MDSCAWVPDKIEENDILYVVFSEGNLKKNLLCVDICTNVCAIHLHARVVKFNFNFAHLFI